MVAKNAGQLDKLNSGTTPPPPTQNAAPTSTYLDVQAGALAKNVGGFLASGVKSGAGLVGGFVKNLFAPQPFSPTRSPRIGPFYQVKESDTSLGQVARNLNLDPSRLVEANYGIKSLPPRGSFIATRQMHGDAGFRYGGGSPTTGLPLGANLPGGANGPSEVGAMNAIKDVQNVAAAITAFNQSNIFDAKPNYSLLPQIISKQAQVANNITAADLLLNGYHQDPSTGTWYSAGGGGASGGKPGRNFKGSIIHNPSQGREAGPVALPENASQSPQTVLSLRLGSG